MRRGVAISRVAINSSDLRSVCPRELVKPATCSDMDDRLLSLGITSERIVFPRRMATSDVWIPEL